MAQTMLLSYATLIISFLAGTLWSASVTHPLSWQVAVVSNLTMLLAWVILLLHSTSGILIWASLLLALLLFYEYWHLRSHYPVKLLRMRQQLTLIAVVSLIAASLTS